MELNGVLDRLELHSNGVYNKLLSKISLYIGRKMIANLPVLRRSYSLLSSLFVHLTYSFYK
jgi:hypothetical protein